MDWKAWFWVTLFILIVIGVATWYIWVTVEVLHG